MIPARIARPIAVLAITAALLSLGVGLAGAAYPDRPIKMIVPWAAGGDTDAIKRVVANALEKQLGQPVVVVNITGASGTVGAREAKGETRAWATLRPCPASS